MTIGLRLFLSSATFGVAIAAVYWTIAKDPTGTMLLGLMAIALVFVAGYMIVAEREAHLVGDNAEINPADAVGENLGVYTLRSPWPVWLAVCIMLTLLGVAVATPLAWLGLAVALYVLWGLVIESA